MSDKKYVISNKQLESEEKLHGISFDIEGNLNESGFSGKYLATVLIKDNNGRKVLKDYICSVLKKEKNTEYVFLNHLETEEVLDELDQKIENK